MSSLAISNSASTTLPAINFHGHGHGHKGLQQDALSPTGGNTASQIPVGTLQGLFSNLLKTLEQVVGVQSTSATAAVSAASASAATGNGTAATAAAATASATPAANPTVAHDLNGFLHSLFQVLKQDGLGGSTGAGTPAAAQSTAAGQYQGSLASSLQTLIQQVGSNGTTTPNIANLNSSFNSLVQDLGLNGASTSAASAAGPTAPPSSASLQNFLNNLLQNLQANGLQGPKLTGSNVNANV